MSLSRDDLEQVGVYVRSHLNEWLPREVFDLQERIIRVEDELRAQREVMIARFDASDKRFEEQLAQMNERFKQQQAHMDARFEEARAQSEARFADARAHADTRFEAQQTQMDRRFAHVDRHLRVHEWLIGGGMVLLATMMTLYQFLS